MGPSPLLEWYLVLEGVLGIAFLLTPHGDSWMTMGEAGSHPLPIPIALKHKQLIQPQA